ncbi:hypothetical protein OIU77_005184 [Salix suchowensis]|uniref:Uncharacterized protein n=1 Tax=Salix suchowensis TaxID=1278906 RepID=A0ABQ9AQJ2_9ROSI|nr:hypothetical protein OIU77_005184 [Salix suchowensis]
MAIGAGGIRSSSLAFGADQLGKRDKLQRAGILESYSGKLREGNRTQHRNFQSEKPININGKHGAEAVDFEPEDDDLMDEDGAVDVDASSSPRAPLPKLKSEL